MARHDKITAATLNATLDHFEAIQRGYVAHLARNGVADFRVTLARMIDAGAPIADWRLDPRVAAVVIPDALPRVRDFDLLGNLKLDIYGGVEAETLRGIRNEYAKRMVDFFFADKPPFPKCFGPEMTLAAHLIRYMPSVEDFIDHGFRFDAADESVAA